MAERSVTTSGTGTADTVPDAVAVVITVAVQGETPAQALDGCGVAQDAVLTALGTAARAGRVAVQATWDHQRERPGRPEATSTVSCRLSDYGTAGEVVTAALAAGGTAARLDAMTAVVTDDSAALLVARRRAFDRARAAAETYAAEAGARVGPVLRVHEGGGDAVAPGRKAMAVVDSGFAMAGGAQEVFAQVTVAWELLD